MSLSDVASSLHSSSSMVRIPASQVQELQLLQVMDGWMADWLTGLAVREEPQREALENTPAYF